MDPMLLDMLLFFAAIGGIVLSIFVIVTWFKLCGRVRDIRGILLAGHDLEEARNEWGAVVSSAFRKSQPVVDTKELPTNV